MGAVWLWRHRLPRRWWSVLVGVAMFLAIPFGMSALSRGITPPADGTPLGLWLTWQLALFLAATGPIVLAAALLRGNAEPRRIGWASWLGVAAAIFAAVVGLYIWQPLVRVASLVPASLGTGAAGGEPALCRQDRQS